MHKKQLDAITASAVASVVKTANNEAEDNEPELTEMEARTLFARKYKKAVRQIVADTVGCEVADVQWVTVEPKSRKKKDAADEQGDEATQQQDAA